MDKRAPALEAIVSSSVIDEILRGYLDKVKKEVIEQVIGDTRFSTSFVQDELKKMVVRELEKPEMQARVHDLCVSALADLAKRRERNPYGNY